MPATQPPGKHGVPLRPPAAPPASPRLQEALHGPHVVQAPSGVGGSSLKFANHFYPDAASLGGVRVVCACGDAVRGRALWGAGSAADGSSSMDDFTLSHASLVSTASVDGSAVDAGTQPSRYDQWLAFGAYKVRRGKGWAAERPLVAP